MAATESKKLIGVQVVVVTAHQGASPKLLMAGRCTKRECSTAPRPALLLNLELRRGCWLNGCARFPARMFNV